MLIYLHMDDTEGVKNVQPVGWLNHLWLSSTLYLFETNEDWTPMLWVWDHGHMPNGWSLPFPNAGRIFTYNKKTIKKSYQSKILYSTL